MPTAKGGDTAGADTAAIGAIRGGDTAGRHTVRGGHTAWAAIVATVVVWKSASKGHSLVMLSITLTQSFSIKPSILPEFGNPWVFQISPNFPKFKRKFKRTATD